MGGLGRCRAVPYSFIHHMLWTLQILAKWCVSLCAYDCLLAPGG